MPCRALTSLREKSTRARAHTHTHTHTQNARTHACTHARIDAHTRTYTRTHSRTHAHIYQFMFRLVAEDPSTSDVMPKLTTYTADLFHPSFTHDKHVAYVGFPVRPFQITASTTVHGVNLGFTVGRLPEGSRLTTVQGGSTRFSFECVNSTNYCAQSPSTSCNGTSTPTCTCLAPVPGAVCPGFGSSACPGRGVCVPCWQIGKCPTQEGNMTFSWVPVAGQEGVHTLCFDAVAQRPANLCPDARAVGCAVMVSDMKCVVIGTHTCLMAIVDLHACASVNGEIMSWN
jgi:hypothetical protein